MLRTIISEYKITLQQINEVDFLPQLNCKRPTENINILQIEVAATNQGKQTLPLHCLITCELLRPCPKGDRHSLLSNCGNNQFSIGKISIIEVIVAKTLGSFTSGQLRCLNSVLKHPLGGML